MSEPLTFSVLGEPVPKARPRFASRYGRVTVRSAPKSEAYHRQVQAAAWLEMRGREKFSGPVAIEARFVFRPPPSWSERRKIETLGADHCQKPDLDNLLKSLLDGMNMVVFADDAAVVQITARKQWGPMALAVCTVTWAMRTEDLE
jgi:Holliday junction resolvase RusA-like endonuclease